VQRLSQFHFQFMTERQACRGCIDLVVDESGCPRCDQVNRLTSKLQGKEDVIYFLRQQLRDCQKKLAKYTGIDLPKEEDLYSLRDEETVEDELEKADDPRYRSYFRNKKRRRLLDEAIDLTGSTEEPVDVLEKL
jgi:phage FluMu protein Com